MKPHCVSLSLLVALGWHLTKATKHQSYLIKTEHNTYLIETEDKEDAVEAGSDYNDDYEREPKTPKLELKTPKTPTTGAGKLEPKEKPKWEPKPPKWKYTPKKPKTLIKSLRE